MTEYEKKFYELKGHQELRIQYSVAVLTEEAILKLSKFQPILEVGAGLGYWAYEFQKKGISYIATDIDCNSRNHSWWDRKTWTDVEKIDAVSAIKKYRNCTLLFCWPYTDWATEALKFYDGESVIYCCEENDAFHNVLKKDWNEVDVIDIPKWPRHNDRIFIFKRKIC